MIIELVLWAGTAAALHWAIFREMSDKKKIETVFENVKFGFKDKLPKHSWTHKKDQYTIYTYNVPYGLVDNPKLEYILEKALNKPVKLEMDSQLRIKVYKSDLKTEYDYEVHKTNNWSVPIGYSLDKMIYHDFDKVPHMTVAGMTRYGKTVLLKLMFFHLINNKHDDVEFYIIDLKGGLEFHTYSNLKQVKYVASNINESYRCLTKVKNQIQQDMKRFKDNEWNNIKTSKIRKRRFVIVDEGAELAPGKHHTKEEKEMLHYCQNALSEIARVAGGLGWRLIFATQYPTTDTLPRQIKQNADAKISFRLPTEVASRVAIDEQGAEQLGVPGRAIYRSSHKHIVQVPLIDDVTLKLLKEWECAANTTEDPTTRKDTVHFG